MEYCKKIRLEEEHRLLQNSNSWLVSDNEQFIRLCTERAILLNNRQQTSESLQQALAGILEDCDKHILSSVE
jgi:hypothetical protein